MADSLLTLNPVAFGCTFIVMAGLVLPSVEALLPLRMARDKPGHDDEGRSHPGRVGREAGGLAMQDHPIALTRIRTAIAAATRLVDHAGERSRHDGT